MLKGLVVIVACAFELLGRGLCFLGDISMKLAIGLLSMVIDKSKVEQADS